MHFYISAFIHFGIYTWDGFAIAFQAMGSTVIIIAVNIYIRMGSYHGSWGSNEQVT
jgi:hypothetical protein